MRNDANEIVLAPFYDLLATKLLLPEDKEETALTINGKKNKLKKDDFLVLGKNLLLSDKVVRKSFERILKPIPDMKKLIEKSFVSRDLQKEYGKLIDSRGKVLA
jgi:serine/threonine-protein kinase HipA